MLSFVRFFQVIGAITLMARDALGEWIRERSDVTGGFPDFLRKDDAGIQSHNIFALGDHRLPPLTLHIVL